MTIKEMLDNTPADSFHLQEKRPGIYQLIAPIFHDDGDMVSIYLEKETEDTVKICDHGSSLMRLSYLFDVDTDKKKKILNDIIIARGASLENGDIELYTSGTNLFSGIMSFAQLVSEVCNMDILTREMVSSMFYDYLTESIEKIGNTINKQHIRNYEIKNHPEICIDYAFMGNENTRPIYLFGVKDTNKAQQTTINCLTMTLEKIPHKSICVFENMDTVTTFARNSLINATGKVYSDLNSFQNTGAEYISNELIA